MKHKTGRQKIYSVNNPLLFTIDDLLAEDVLENLIADVEQLPFEKAKVVPAVGETESRETFRRKAATCGLAVMQSKAAWSFISAVSGIVRLHPAQAEDLSCVKYGLGELYDAHHDTFNEETLTKMTPEAGNRILTAILYLNDVEEGGQTSFPELNLSIEPKRNRLLVFSTTHTGTEQSLDCSKHMAEPVIKGRKLITNLWFRKGVYNQELYDNVSKTRGYDANMYK